MKPPRLTLLQFIVHLAGWLPLAWLVFDFATDNLTANPIQAIEQRTGFTAVTFLVLSLACIQLRMLPEEAIAALTLNAAAAMRLDEELGGLTAGKRASFIITKEVPSLAYLPYAFGTDHIDTVIIDGKPFRAGAALQ